MRIAALCLLLLGGVASADTLSGSWSSPFGTVKISQEGDRVVGSAKASAACPLPRSGHLLEGDLLEDSLSGQLFVCPVGCDRGPGWVPVLLLLASDGRSLSGTSTLPHGCKASFGSGGRNGGALILRRAAEAADPIAEPTPAAGPDLAAAPAGPDSASKAAAKAKPKPATAADHRPSRAEVPRESPKAREQALALARDGAAFQDEGKFEQARNRFLEAIQTDPLYAEGYNGVGVTFFARNDLAEALRWYKKALGADPSFGDAYYNMACVYALQNRAGLALRYLRTAFHNGYTSRDTLRHDPDLASLHGNPAFEGLVGEAQ